MNTGLIPILSHTCRLNSQQPLKSPVSLSLSLGYFTKILSCRLVKVMPFCRKNLSPLFSMQTLNKHVHANHRAQPCHFHINRVRVDRAERALYTQPYSPIIHGKRRDEISDFHATSQLHSSHKHSKTRTSG